MNRNSVRLLILGVLLTSSGEEIPQRISHALSSREALSPLKRALKGCRKIVGVDGTHLSGPFKGIILIAIGLDGDNGSFPIACAIVDKENKANWVYFFTCLRQVIGEDADYS